MIKQVAAVSVGIVDDAPTLDLEYAQDSRAQVDMNVVMTRDARGNMEYVEVQGTGEGRSFSHAELNRLLSLAQKGIRQLMKAQVSAIGERAYVIGKKPRLAVATHNFGKLKEIRALLGDLYDICSASEIEGAGDVEETGETFAENALIKAKALMECAHCACLADDSGLMVDALDGKPGVYSARYAGVHGDDGANNEKLLRELENVPAPRTARFVSAVCLLRPGREPLICEGACEGEIAFEPRGNGGFGYDPLFVSHDLDGQTFGEAPDGEKQKVSHRARAIARLRACLEEGK